MPLLKMKTPTVLKIHKTVLNRAEVKAATRDWHVDYSFFQTQFGVCLVASTEKGISNILFADTKKEALADLKNRWPHATLQEKHLPLHTRITQYLKGGKNSSPIPLHLIGTDFQIKVWQKLLSIDSGKTCSYKSIAEKMGDPLSSRAVGTAIGANPVGYIIPCHRVLTSSGKLGGYHWGLPRKEAMLAYEATKKRLQK
jgi:AraC family transcriptional regulator of adaptative response/methylated-DNA-[protein]-cysteine methyltransferase